MNSDSWIPVGSTFKDRTNAGHSGQKHSGHKLSRLLSSEPAPPALVIPSFLSVIAAVEEVHRDNKGPCDLDPRNVFLRSDGTVELSTLTPAASGMTVVLNSSKYSAPEMVEETSGHIDTILLDSYMLGFVFYEILLGSDRFEQQFQEVAGQGKFGWLTWHADKTKRAKPLSEVMDGFPSVLSNLIAGMMAKDTSERIGNLQRIADTISEASQATMVISNLSALRGPDQGSASQKASASQKVDFLWRWLFSVARDALRRVPWNPTSARRHKQTQSRAQDA